MYGSQWGSLQAAAVYKKLLQVTWESESDTASRALRLVWMRNEVHTIKSLLPKYTGKNITHLLLLVLLLVLRIRNNTDGNKLVIFSV